MNRGFGVIIRATGVTIAIGVYWLASSAIAEAGELRYQPINPHFGGSPFNGAVLLQNAQIQNPFQASNGGSGGASNSGGSGGTDAAIPAITFPEFNFSAPGTTAIIIGPPTSQ